LYARYNTNLSRVNYKGQNLYKDILANIRDWQICASIDGTGAIGEYIRTGLNYDQFVDNFKQGCNVATHKRQMRLDFTLTLPGLFEVERMQQLADELGVEILAKVIFTFTPDIIMSPLALPRKILDRMVDQLINNNTLGSALQDVLVQLKNRPNMEEQFADYTIGMQKGKRRVLKLESIRKDTFTMKDILSADQEVLDWWESIDVR
jgi:hypothetical protein